MKDLQHRRCDAQAVWPLRRIKESEGLPAPPSESVDSPSYSYFEVWLSTAHVLPGYYRLFRSVLRDNARGMFLGDTIYDDTNADQIERLARPNLVGMLISKPSIQKKKVISKAISYILSPTMYGLANGNEMIGGGKNMWPNVEIHERVFKLCTTPLCRILQPDMDATEFIRRQRGTQNIQLRLPVKKYSNEGSVGQHSSGGTGSAGKAKLDAFGVLKWFHILTEFCALECQATTPRTPISSNISLQAHHHLYTVDDCDEHENVI
ncbi:hypothetical protein B0H10DRAFT_1947824 [Mycena sp. CBHHK59/15]|nr:hypothetical protein B0H10DRAFT_1947824 [Mycena sp. CBHHK59/15]